MIGLLPQTLKVCNKDYEIRSDFRDVLRIIMAYNDKELSNEEKYAIEENTKEELESIIATIKKLKPYPRTKTPMQRQSMRPLSSSSAICRTASPALKL